MYEQRCYSGGVIKAHVPAVIAIITSLHLPSTCLLSDAAADAAAANSLYNHACLGSLESIV